MTDHATTAEGRPREGHGTAHVVPVGTYIAVFIALMVLTILTVVASRLDLGALNTPVALGIAVTKALLVILFFMHVRWSSRLTWVVAASGFVWLIILFTITLTDYLTRGWVAGSLR